MSLSSLLEKPHITQGPVDSGNILFVIVASGISVEALSFASAFFLDFSESQYHSKNLLSSGVNLSNGFQSV
jgi:hypothetical protein